MKIWILVLAIHLLFICLFSLEKTKEKIKKQPIVIRTQLEAPITTNTTSQKKEVKKAPQVKKEAAKAAPPIPPKSAQKEMAPTTKNVPIPRVVEKSGIAQGGDLNLSQAKPQPLQRNLNKLGDAGGPQIQRQADVEQNRFFNHERYASKSVQKEDPPTKEFLDEVIEKLSAVLENKTEVIIPSHLCVPSLLPSSGQHAIPHPTYSQAVMGILLEQLDLPEIGEVVMNLEIDASGVVKKIEILNSKSTKNSEFLKKRLQELSFPCFNGFGLIDPTMNFTIAFKNVENRP